ncbi:hypothetical protein WR25_01373 [Diploscapter pachys]|uniref:SH3 domain-containing protein n=1 Tax=Diploscapter pachys TaxID=2018661 RepID=A0A2A2KV78_9BILA|nr:hypothetical protein WR25_01373 [Diploscapter pachys]
MPPRLNALNNALNASNKSPLKSKLIDRDRETREARNGKALNGSSDLSDWRSCSPVVQSRRSSSQLATGASSGYIVIHEYAPSNGSLSLQLGERVHVVDNGDPDWLHGFRISDRTEHLMTFPATCVAHISSNEQPMIILQNVFVSEFKLRMYKNQVVFAQPDTLSEGKVTVRTEHNALAPVSLTSLALL